MSGRRATYHSLERTSPYGGPFYGTCRLCGQKNLPMMAVSEKCSNPRQLSEDEDLLEAIDPSRKEPKK